MRAYYAKESPIPAPIISHAVLSPSLVLQLSLFNPQDFFVLKELLPPKKQVCFLSSSSTDSSDLLRNQAYNLAIPSFLVHTPIPPQIFEIGKSSIKMHPRHHEKQIKDILNYLEELSFYRIEKIRSQISELQKKHLGQKDKIVFARFRISNIEQALKDIQAPLEAQAANMANTDNTNRNSRPRETPIAKRGNYKEFISCQPFYLNGIEGVWNAYVQPIGIEKADKISWTELKRLLTNKYCPQTEVKKMEDEFYNLVVKGNDLKTYIRRFQELVLLCPNMVPNSKKLMEVFIGGLPRSIKGNVIASKPQSLEESVTIIQRLMEQVIKHNSA
nr:reverse transcriptase domain-containing protein [Tanacetum cinerariifolium]